MSVSLYRKYRPTEFKDVLDQKHIVDSLESAIKSGTISHAYLFAGSRGTGKTSIARIFAREIGTSPNDIYEIDAASNRGINEAKELIAGVSTLPFDSKYKVYILDEVHMLTKEAWNAFLKTLEEPPAHVVFILATTELHKVPDTVRSRCQVFEFKKPPIETLSKMLIEGAHKEGFTLMEAGADLVARMGDGSFRDAWGVLERVLSTVHDKKQDISKYEVLAAVSMTDRELAYDFVEALVSADLNKTLSILEGVIAKGHSVDQFLEYIIETCRLVLLYRFAPDFAKTLHAEMVPGATEKVIAWSAGKNIIDSKLMRDIIELIGETKKTSMPQIPIELALIRILGNNQKSE